MVRYVVLCALVVATVLTANARERDTITVSYDKIPGVSVAAVYYEVMKKLCADEAELVRLLATRDETMYEALREAVDSIGTHTVDPNLIIKRIQMRGGSKYESLYVRLCLTIMTNRWFGFQSPLEVRFVFDSAGFLEFFACRGFAKLNDGFVLHRPFLMQRKIHHTELTSLGY
jgi:hypothetical protein